MKRLAFAVAAAIVGTSGVVFATDLPHQKVGLWKQTLTRDDAAVPNLGTSQICLDQAAEAKLSVFSQQAASSLCQPPKIVHNPDGSWSSDSMCALGGGIKSKAHAVVTGDFNSTITTTIDSIVTGAPAESMNGKHRMVVTATWVGACKPGQKGGDMIMANGMKLNLLDMAKAMQAMSGKPSSH